MVSVSDRRITGTDVDGRRTGCTFFTGGGGRGGGVAGFFTTGGLGYGKGYWTASNKGKRIDAPLPVQACA